jgi:hypothetical protein
MDTMLTDKRKLTTHLPTGEKGDTQVMIAIPNLGWIRMGLIHHVIEWISIYGGVVHHPEGYRPVSYARNMCVAAFLQSACTHLWFVDSDTVPPPGAFQMLLEADKEAITGVTRVVMADADGQQKSVPMVAVYDPNATNPDKTKGGYRPIANAKVTGIRPLDVAGASCLMLRRSVFDKVEGPPWFDEESWGSNRGEDFRFCQRMKEAGIQLYGHFDVKCIHWTTVPLI